MIADPQEDERRVNDDRIPLRPEGLGPRASLRRSESIRLGPWHQFWVYGASALLALSGIVWLVQHYLLAVPSQFGTVVHPFEHLTLSIHGGAAMLGLIVYGSLVPIHIRRAWAIRRNIVAGIVVAAVLIALTVTGYLLYYAGSEEARPIIGIVHWALGLAAPVLLTWHVVTGRARPRNASLP